MKDPRRLSLKREALTDLTGTDLELVVGGAQAATLLGLCDTSANCSLRCQWTFNTCEA